MALLRSVSFHYNVDEMLWEPSSGLCQLACKMGLVMSFQQFQEPVDSDVK